MEAALLILSLLASLLLPTVQQVMIIPSGVLLVPQNTETRIYCNITVQVLTSGWTITKGNDTEYGSEGTLFSGIIIADTTGSSSTLVLNTTVIKDEFTAECVGVVQRPNGSSKWNTETIQDTLNVIVFGVPDQPTNIFVSNMDNLLTLSWLSHTIENITQTYDISLTFYYPSKLKNLSKTVNTTQLNLDLEGLRSCDKFRVCVAARNIVGQGKFSCIEEQLSYVPSQHEINFSQKKRKSGILLEVNISMPEECYRNDLNYVLKIFSDENNFTYTSRTSPASVKTVLVENNLNVESIYTFQILSYNSLGNGESEALDFSTSGVIGMSMCQTTIRDEYNITCLYIDDLFDGDCNFNLISQNSNHTFGLFSVRDDYHVTKIPNIYTYQRILVFDEDYMLVRAMSFNPSNILTCYSETGTNFPITQGTMKKNSVIKIIAIALSTVFVAIIITIICFILLYCKVCRTNSLSWSPAKENKSTFSKKNVYDVSCMQNSVEDQVFSNNIRNDSTDHLKENKQEPFYYVLENDTQLKEDLSTSEYCENKKFGQQSQDAVYDEIRFPSRTT